MLLPIPISATVGSNDHLHGLYGVADLKKCGGGGNLECVEVDGKSLITVYNIFLGFISVEIPH